MINHIQDLNIILNLYIILAKKCVFYIRVKDKIYPHSVQKDSSLDKVVVFPNATGFSFFIA